MPDRKFKSYVCAHVLSRCRPGLDSAINKATSWIFPKGKEENGK